MEKIKFGTEVFELIPAGATFRDEKARAVFILPDDMSYDDVETAVSGCDRIEVLDENDDVLVAYTGFVYLDSLTKQKDYVIGTEQVESDADESGNITYVNHDVTATVMIVALKKSDLRSDVETVNAKVDYVAMMNGIDLEV